MSGIGSWLWGSSQLDDAIDKATSELLPAGAEDIALNLEICDQIRSKSVPAKDAMRALKRRLNHKNPNVQLLALSLTDICIKNGGDLLLAEVASREFMDNLVSILKVPALNSDVKNTILRLIQNWSVAFEGKPVLSYVGQVYKTLTSEGYKFPPKDLAVANSAMVDTQTAPDWIDSDLCLRCRTPFSFTNRKHHCRNCGQVFDQQCSSKTMALPHFGITQEVRVCDGCHAKLTKKGLKQDKIHRHSTSVHGSRHRSARELADAELQRAIQLSLEEVGATNGQKRTGYVPRQPSPSRWQISEPPIVDRASYPDRKPAIANDDDDPDLKAAIEASLREASAPKPSAPIETPRIEQQSFSYGTTGYSQSYPSHIVTQTLPSIPNYDLEPIETDAILTFNQTVEQVQAQGGRDISRYPAVTELYQKASNLRPKLAMSLDDTGRKEDMLSNMHDKLSQAVKLYDQILTEQVAHPSWRSAPAPAPAPVSYQPASTFYQANSYNQWNHQGQEYQPQPQSPQTSYTSPVSISQYKTQYFNPQAESSQQAQSQWHPQQQQYDSGYSEQHTAAQPVQQYPQSSIPAPPQLSPPLAPVPSPPSLQYSQPAQYQQMYTAPINQAMPPVSYNPQPRSANTLATQSAPPVPQSPPMSTQYAPPITNLQRHNTLSYTSSPQPAIVNSHVSRSNTVASQPPSHIVRRHQQAPQHYMPAMPSAPVTAPLPQFPNAPTSTPTYGSAAGVEQHEERKEALLIDL